MCAFGFARRLCTHAGCLGPPAYDPTMRTLPSTGRYASGDTRGCPDLAPVVCSNSRVPFSNGPPTLPPLARNSSTTLLLKSSSAAVSEYSFSLSIESSVMPAQAFLPRTYSLP